MLRAHTVVFPEIAAGRAGITSTVTDFVRAADEPQELFAVTEIVPPVVPAVALIDVVVDEPLHPAGNVHV